MSATPLHKLADEMRDMAESFDTGCTVKAQYWLNHYAAELEAALAEQWQDTQQKAKSFINANVWDGEDRSGCDGDYAKFTPDELASLIEDLLEHITPTPDQQKP